MSKVSIGSETLERIIPDRLARTLKVLKRETGDSVYLAGGTVRDLLLGKMPEDIDLTVAGNARSWAGRLADETGGAYVALGRNEDAARVVFDTAVADFSSFRQGARTIEEELGKRDLTINSMGVCLDLFLESRREAPFDVEVVDPWGGVADLEKGLVRMTFSEAFKDDPLRLLRVFRFAAVLGFSIEGGTLQAVARQGRQISRVAGERISHELDLIMGSRRAAATVRGMADTGLLWELLPVLQQGVGMEQPSSHHLDVFEHNVETLAQMERLLGEDGHGFPADGGTVRNYARNTDNRLRLKWAALLHDIGKPAVHGIDETRGGRITFHNHERVGADILRSIGRELRWSRRAEEQIRRLVSLHMRPFHLVTTARKEQVSTKACIRLLKSAGEDLPGLFLLAMADCAAGKGAMHPPDMGEQLLLLYSRVELVRKENVEPVTDAPPLVTGNDLIRELDLEPGPLFKEILSAIDEARMRKVISERGQALELARKIAGQISNDQ